MNQVKQSDVDNLSDNNYIRVLGFNSKGQKFIKDNKEDISFITQFKHLPDDYKEIEWKANLLYYSLFSDNEDKIKRELGSPLIVK